MGHLGLHTNADCPNSVIEQTTMIDSQSQRLLQDAAEKMQLSARAYHRVLKVSRTLADLEGSQKVMKTHIAEAISYRCTSKSMYVGSMYS